MRLRLCGERVSRHYHGTRELAHAAGVSEALMFKHFPNKEALFSAMLTACCSEQDIGRFERLKELDPGSATLVLMVLNLVSFFLGRTGAENEDLAIQDRLMLRSLAEDGEFAPGMCTPNWRPTGFPGIVTCLQAAAAAGDAEPLRAVQADLACWFVHSLTLMVHLLLFPANPVVNFHVRRNALIEQIVWFLLRGMGLKETAIRQHYNKKTLSQLGDRPEPK